ncbi:amidase [Cantharellus anzutake]|uniref:amidase n=1 Tax=Cantharellus anzutake TaxID=1750568 RepID=UPI00190895B1|nr:amidase [Cantharellus anzutake]KAF8332353.1 amidase [Cantharellus anzutake]
MWSTNRPKTNCLTEIFVDDALRWAQRADEYLATHKKPIGSLHGLPISLKDQCRIIGLETIMGYVSWIGQKAKYNCTLVDILLEAGGVPFVRTNVPQTLWWGETHNNVFGRTFNPYNRSLTCGGSSGGESALLALGGSPLGIGTDIGGSVRIPTVFTGLYGLRPSTHRLPYWGLVNSCLGQESIHSVLGPMAPSLTALREFTKAVIDRKPWLKDPTCVKIPWDQAAENLSDHGGSGAQLCFAFMWDNGIVKPTPPVTRALEITKRALHLIDWINLLHHELHVNIHRIYAADGGEDATGDCAASGEPLLHTLIPCPDEHEEFGYHFGPIPKPVTSDGRIFNHPPLKSNLERMSAGYGELGNKTPPSTGSSAEYETEEEPPGKASAWGLWKLHAELRAHGKAYLDHWEATKSRTGTGRPVDAIICPGAAYPAPPHGYNSDSFYTSLWNGLDYSSCTFPVTTVDVALDQKLHRHTFHNHEDEFIYSWYDPAIFRHAPVGLQLVGRTHEEEAVLSMTQIVMTALEVMNIQESR